MTLQDVTPQPETFSSVQLDGTVSQIPEISSAFDDAKKAGLILSCHLKLIPDDNLGERWQISFVDVITEIEITGEIGDWFVVSSLKSVQILTDTLYQSRFNAS